MEIQSHTQSKLMLLAKDKAYRLKPKELTGKTVQSLSAANHLLAKDGFAVGLPEQEKLKVDKAHPTGWRNAQIKARWIKPDVLNDLYQISISCAGDGQSAWERDFEGDFEFRLQRTTHAHIIALTTSYNKMRDDGVNDGPYAYGVRSHVFDLKEICGSN